MKLIQKDVYCFDAEWVPCLTTGRLVNGLPENSTDSEIRDAMWKRAGATPENPHPFLKLMQSQVVSISAVHRHQNSDGSVSLRIKSYPAIADATVPEGEIVGSFLNEAAECSAQLVGFNSAGADLPILVQRGLAARCRCEAFGRRPERPWEGTDYLARFSEAHIDLAYFLTAGSGARGAAMPSLDEIAAALLIPGKLDHSGAGVLDLWLQEDYAALTGYNETDACTTYLVWLRLAYFLGKVNEAQMKHEIGVFRALLRSLTPSKPHLGRFLAVWKERAALWKQLPPVLPVQSSVRDDCLIASFASTGQRCEISVTRTALDVGVWARIERHLVEAGPGRHYLCELGCSSDGGVVPGTVNGSPFLMKVATADLAGVMDALDHAIVHSAEEWVDPHAA